MANQNQCTNEIGKFVLSGEELKDVLMLNADGKVSQNPGRYISRLTDEMVNLRPARYLSGGVCNNAKQMRFRFYKQCKATGCNNKLLVSCNKSEFINGKVEFVLYENDIACDCVQELRSRPLIGNNFIF